MESLVPEPPSNIQQPGQMKRVKCGQEWGQEGRGGGGKGRWHKIAFNQQNG